MALEACWGAKSSGSEVSGWCETLGQALLRAACGPVRMCWITNELFCWLALGSRDTFRGQGWRERPVTVLAQLAEPSSAQQTSRAGLREAPFVVFLAGQRLQARNCCPQPATGLHAASGRACACA